MIQPAADDWRRWGIDPDWSRVLDVPGATGTHRWHVLDRPPAPGAPPASTVVCVHGNPTWSYLWRDVLVRLGDRRRVIAVDQLGMGWSDRTGPRDYARRVADLGDVIDASGADADGPIVLVGHDWGGAIAMGWAVDHPERLARLVLCNTGIAVPAGRRAPGLIRLAASGPITDLACRRTPVFVEGTVCLSWRRLGAPARAALRAPYRGAARRSAVADFVGDVPFDDRHPSSAAIAAVADRLATVTAPTLLVWGAGDPVFDDSFALDLAARLPHADRHRFDRVGHLAPLEADVAGVLDAWLLAPAATPPSEEPAGAPFVSPWSALDALAHDDGVAFVDGASGDRTSFRELAATITRTASNLAAAGLRPGDRVAVLVPPSVELLAVVYGVWRAGGVTVIADRGLGLGGLGRAVRGAHVDWVVGPRAARAAATGLRWAPRARRLDVDALTRRGGTSPVPPEPDADAPAAVLYTSGATGPAKGVRYTQRQLAAQRDALAATYSITRADRLVAAFAPFALYGPALGIASTIPDVDVTAPGSLTAAALGDAVASIDATIVFAAPAALANVLRTSDDGPDPRLAEVRLVLSAGAPVPVATLRAMSQRCPGAELHTPYGMTECLPVSDTSLTEIDAAGPGRGVCVGLPVAGVEVLVAPLGFDAGAPVAPVTDGTTGEVLVRAPWRSDGYDQRWLTERDARPCDAAGRVWHRTGDVGHVDARGVLWIEGRSVHVVHAVDRPITPVPVEVAVETLPDVERCAAVGVGPAGCQQVVVVVERPDAKAGLAPDELTAAVRTVLTGSGVTVAAVLVVPALPVDIRHNTKIDRTLVARWATDVLGGAPRRPGW